ncbi:MAG: acyl-ACP--UDP-N-acetylglucosamine O-acyltransferase [Gammaproteobacteria bacterium]|nr:acyl-ACP--UDP-N-acetylglucosamine O-acyltransferase [Gammaproteobacteria bacterium]
MSIHPTAIVADEAQISPDASIGPYCVVSGAVTIGAGTVIESHARIGSRFGEVVIGDNNYIQSGAAIGGPPQDRTYQESRTRLEIGNGNRIGENVTVHLGTAKGGGVTRIGSDTLLMAYSHVAHDCQVLDNASLINLAQLSGHVTVEEGAVVGGIVAVSQFVRLGALSFLALGAMVNKDILPYTIAEGHWAVPKATNKVGLRRAGYCAEDIREIDNAIRILLDRSKTIDAAVDEISAAGSRCAGVEHLLEFVASSRRGLARS